MKRVLLPVAALTVLYLAALALWPDSLNHNSEYAWPLLRHGVVGKLWLAALALLVIIVMIAALYRSHDWDKLGRWQGTYLGLFILLMALLLQVIPMTVHKLGLLEFPLRIYVPDHTSYFTDAVALEKYPGWVKDFPSLASQLHTHSRTHPPGAIMFFKNMNRAAKKHPASVEWYFKAIPRSQEAAKNFNLTQAQVAGGGLAAGLIILLILLFVMMSDGCYQLFEEKNIVILAAIFLFAFTPAFSNKTPVLDQAFALFIFLAIYFFFLGLKKNQPWWGIFSGYVLCSGLNYSYTFLAAFPLLLLLLAAWWWKTRSSPPLVIFLLFVLGVAIALSVYVWIWKYDLIAIWHVNEAGWYFNNTTSGRIHMWKWILFNPYEFFAWLGVPVFCFFALAVWREIKKAWQKQWREIDPLVWAIFVFGVALDLSGRVCYESPRLCWFYAPFVCLVAAKGLVNTEGLNRAWALGGVLALQAATVLVFRMLF